MQTFRKLKPLLRVSRQSVKPKPVSNLVDLQQARKLRAPRLIPLTYEGSGNTADYLNRGVESFRNGFSMEGEYITETSAARVGCTTELWMQASVSFLYIKESNDGSEN